MGPKTLDEALAMLPGLRKRRSLNADWIRCLLDRKKGECSWCGEPCRNGRRTWCSDECLTTFQSRCSPPHQAQHVTDRDKGICQLCGRDTVASEKEFRERWAVERNQYGQMWSQYRAAMESLQKQYGHGRGKWREVDHIVPVVDGGGLCSTDNLRLLCGQCHARVTRELSRRARKKPATS